MQDFLLSEVRRPHDTPAWVKPKQRHFEQFTTSRNTRLYENQRNLRAVFYLVADRTVQLFGE